MEEQGDHGLLFGFELFLCCSCELGKSRATWKINQFFLFWLFYKPDCFSTASKDKVGLQVAGNSSKTHPKWNVSCLISWTPHSLSQTVGRLELCVHYVVLLLSATFYHERLHNPWNKWADKIACYLSCFVANSLIAVFRRKRRTDRGETRSTRSLAYLSDVEEFSEKAENIR